MSPSPTVSVVIPTQLRPCLEAAVLSALRQVGVTIEVIVVVDLPSATSADAMAVRRGVDAGARREGTMPGNVTWLASGGSRGAATCRQLGTDEARGQWVAYLDDDDAWRPGKLERQLAAAAGHPSVPALLSCQISSRAASAERAVEPIPRTVYRGDRPLSEWLFHRRRLAADRNILHTSTLVLPTALAQRVGWRSLVRHQDWDFVLRASGPEHGATVIQLDEVLVDVQAGSNGSISASPDWRASHDWLTGVSARLTPRARADFLVGQCGRYALQSGEYGNALRLAREACRSARPSVNAVLLATSGLLSRRTFDGIAHRSTRPLRPPTPRKAESP